MTSSKGKRPLGKICRFNWPQTPDRPDTVLELAMDMRHIAYAPGLLKLRSAWRTWALVFGFKYMGRVLSAYKTWGRKEHRQRSGGILMPNQKTPAAPHGSLRHFVRLVVGSQTMTFEGQETT